MVNIVRRFQGFAHQAPEVETVEFINDDGLTIPYNLLPSDTSLIAQQIRKALETTTVVKEASNTYEEPVVAKSSTPTVQTNEEKTYNDLVAEGVTSITQADVDADPKGAYAYLLSLQSEGFKTTHSL
jgi:hypothetical protein